MPKIRKRELTESERELDEFFNRDNWKTSKRGNTWRNWQGLTLTIFSRDDGFFGWVYADSDGPHYSPRGYETVEESISELAAALCVGEVFEEDVDDDEE